MLKKYVFTAAAVYLGSLYITTSYGEKKMEATMSEKVIKTNSGLVYEDIIVGDGDCPQEGQTVVVHYTGTLTNGGKFDSSEDRGEPFKFSIGKGVVIKGWDEGVMNMKVGGERKLTIPPELGYGSRGFPGVIPENSTLIFNVKLLAIE